jgi:hypothetical protein
MRRLAAFSLSLWCGAIVAAEGPSTNGRPLGAKGPEVVWSAPTNGWPDAVWVYKVRPQQFPPAVVSNLMALAPFTTADRRKSPPYKDKGTMFFGIPGDKYLALRPTLGYVEYHDPKAAAVSQLQPVVGVPNERETTQLGLKCLRLAGIDVSQLATKPGSSDLDLHWELDTLGYTDEKTKEEITLTNKYGVIFNRRVDGIRMGGKGLWGGVWICFGNHGKVADLKISWRNIEPYQLRPFPSPEEVTLMLKDGRTFWPGGEAARRRVRKITVLKATPEYVAKYCDEPEDFVCPHVRLEVAADAETNTPSFAVWTPLMRPSL